MKITIEFNDQAKSGIEKKFLLSVAEKTLKSKEFKFLEKKNISISLATVSEEEIKKLNSTYRKKNQETDVLSFSEYENKKELDKAGDNLYLGEVILCYNYIEERAKKEKKKIKKELAEIISHGILHLLTLEHSPKMFSIQASVKKIF